MGKASKSKREEIASGAAAAGDEGYEFKLPKFDEKAFIRRELQSARASFYVLGLGLAGGLVAGLLYLTPYPWYIGWLPILATMLAARPMLQKLGFNEDVTSWKGMLGSLFMLFFTGLSVWILLVNVL